MSNTSPLNQMSLEEKIRNLIKSEGPVTFACFMEKALFDPEEGYYSRGKATEDYYTSPAAHPVFGALLAIQLEKMWEITGKPQEFMLVEMGAAKGLLAEDILSFLSEWSPPFYNAVRYVAIDRGMRRRDRRRESTTQASKIQPLKSSGIPLKKVKGCFFSNELPDAFPVHRLTKINGRLKEIYVGFENERFQEITGDFSSDKLAEYIAEQGIELEEGQRAEVNLEALRWLDEIYASLESGFVLTIDYGHEASQLYSKRFFQGTLLSYYKHNYTDDVYIRAGQQDITSHVDFSALMCYGRKLGLSNLKFTTQAQFLDELGLNALQDALIKLRLPQKEHYANTLALRNLVSLQGMGDFKVLIQGKELPDFPESALTPNKDLRKEMAERHIAIPHLKPQHLSLLQASYPDYYFPY